MKANKLLLAAAFAGLISLGFAGVAPDYQTRMNEAVKRAYPGRWAASNVTAPAQARPAVPVASCATCSCCAKKS